MDNNLFPSLSSDASASDVLKRSLNNGPPRLTNSPNVSSLNSNLNRLFQYPPTSSLSNIPASIYHQSPHLFTNPQPPPNLTSNLNNYGLNSKTVSQLNLPIDRQDYLDTLNARDSIVSSLNVHQLNHRRRPSLLQSTAYSTESFGGLQPQYLPYLNEKFRENLNNNLLVRNNKSTLLPQHYPQLNSLSVVSTAGNQLTNPSITSQFNPHQLTNLAQQSAPLNFLQNQQSYLDNNELTTVLNNNKRPRLSHIQPLLIDTSSIEIKKEPAYTVQVEAISPTPNEDTTRADGSPIRTTKDDILQQINHIDREITQTENRMSKLKKKQQELEALTNKTGKSSDLNEYLESKQQSITQVIYFENRKKAQDSQQLLENLGSKIILPIYNQPSDNKVYHDNREKFVKFKSLLQQHFKRKLKRKQEREKFLTETYDKLMQEWLQKLESKDTNPVKKSKDSKLREFFEKQFPELKKQREDKERISRAGQRVRSDADLEDIMDGIQEQELEDKKIRAYAVIPPILHDEKERTYRFKTNNCKVDDPVKEHKELMYLNVWSNVEKEIFKEKFLQAPKNFGHIASFLERKSVMDCVQYYYSSKKRENYKQLLRKNAKKRTRALAKQQQLAQQAAAQQEQAQQQLQRTLALQQAKKQLELEKENLIKTDIKMEIGKDDNQQLKKSETIKEEEENDENCLKCINCLKKIELNSKVYVINRTNCFLYGLSMEDVKRNSRLCKKCKVEFGTGECPVPSCKAIKKPNRRLKTLPREWFELTPENRYTFSAELNFPLDCKRCCTRCWIRLIRKYSSSFTNNKNSTMKKFLSCVWDDNEIDKLKNAIRKNGRDWEMISSTQVVTKSAKQCRQFYFYFKYNLNLDELMKMTTFQTDDFDSDTCWNEIASDNESSEDEYLIERKILDPNLEKLQDCKKLSSSLLSLKSDCDSSATMSADEGQSINFSEFDSRITPPSRSSSALPSHLTGTGASFDKSRPASSDNLDIDSKLKTNQKYLNSSLQKGRQTFSSINKPPTQMPSFVKYLINPNAPTVPSSNQSKLLRQDSPITTVNNTPTTLQPQTTQSLNQQTLSQLQATSQQPNQLFTGNPQLSQQVSQASKDKATCVRDLIYQTIDISYQADKGIANKQLEQQAASQFQINQQSKEKSSINPNNIPLYFSSDIKRETVLNDLTSANKALNPALQHIMSPYNLNLPLGLSLTHLNETENEVQDLSKKSNKKDADDYLQPKNYSLSKSKNNEFVNLAAFNSSMPPPAHSNQMSSRTSTPVLDSSQQEQLQNFYLNAANRHTDSPRSIKNQSIYSLTGGESRGLTPNHLSSVSPTPGSNRSGNKSNQSSNKLVPPPLIANNMLNNQQQYSQQQSKSSKNNTFQGSITHGTPVQSPVDLLQQQYLLNKERESAVGSITLGTPLYRSNSRPNMPKLNYMPGQNSFNLPSSLAANLMPQNTIMNQNLSKSNFGNEFQLSTQNQIMIDFNTSKQMQKRNTGGLNESNSNKNVERNSPLSLNRLGQAFTQSGYPQLNFNPTAVSAMNSLFDAQKAAAELNKNLTGGDHKSQSPLLIETSKANSPKISQSPRHNIIQHSAANFQNQNKNQQQQLPSSVIQTSQHAKTSGVPLYSQANDAFQTLVNAAVSQQSLAIPSDKKANDDQLQSKDDKNNFFNHSALKFSRNPFTKEQFEKEIKSQELIKKQQQQNESVIKNERKTPLTNFDLDNQASKIFSDSFQKDTPTSSHMMTAASLIDAIICHQINQPESSKSLQATNLSQKDKTSFNSGISPYGNSNFLNNHLKNLIDNCGGLPSNQSINPLHLLHDPNLLSSVSNTSASNLAAITTKASDDLVNENWKLRKALEQKEAAQRKTTNKMIESHIEIEPISPPSNTPTPTKEHQQNLAANLKQQTQWSNEQLACNSLAKLAAQSQSNIQLESGNKQSSSTDPINFFQNRIIQAMNTENDKLQSLSEKEQSESGNQKKVNDQQTDQVLKKTDKLTETLPISNLDSISSLSELKAQRAEFQKQQQLKIQENEKTD